MGNEIVVNDKRSDMMPPEPATTPAIQMLRMVEKVMMVPDIPIERIEMAIKMKNDMENRDYEKLFYADLAAMQVELPRVIESKKAHNSSYAPLEDINDTIRPAMQKWGFAVTFRVTQPGGAIQVETILSHKAGHHINTVITLPPDTSGSKNGTQAVGSSISYGKRYGISALLNISTGDDTDGYAAGRKDTQTNSPTELSSKALDWVAMLEEQRTEKDLLDCFTTGWASLKGDGAGREAFMKAKDAAKARVAK